MKNLLHNTYLALGLIVACVHTATAGPLVYNSRDLMLCFRQAGATYDLEVNVGQASLYYSATPGATFAVTGFNASQLTSAFGTPYANVQWSVASGITTIGDPTYPKNTLWVTAPRLDVNVQSTPWNRQTSGAQGFTVSGILSVSGSATTYSSSIPPSANNTATAVLIPDGNAQSYNSFVGPNGDFGSFIGSIENITSDTFATGEFSRSDLYQIKPNSAGGPGTYLGYFDLFPDGTMTFTAAGGVAPTPPTISIVNATAQISTNGTSNVVFTVTLSTNSASSVSVNYTTQDGTALASTDYTTTSGTLTFAAGQTNLTISVPALGRTLFKNSVNFTVQLATPVNATLATALATGTIVDAFLPIISAQGITRTNTSSYISFPTFNGLNYTLRYTNLAGLRSPISTWTIAATNLNGIGTTLTLPDDTTNGDRVYVLQATRLP